MAFSKVVNGVAPHPALSPETSVPERWGESASSRGSYGGEGTYGSSQKNCNTIEVTHGKKKGTDPFCAQHPAGRSGKRGLSPFPLQKMLRMLQFF